MSTAYRPDIDGLRAVAVISVILSHAYVPGFSGGFVGVDIFFVISGFLISSIIMRETDEGSFSFKNFYVRRIRRILPALLVVLSVTTVLTSLILLPEDFRRFGKGVLASIIMIPNIADWVASKNYFLASFDSNQLLHLWSLGVEEQFYVLFPVLFLFSVRKFNRQMCWVLLVAIGASSLMLANWSVSHQPEFGFYWLPTRAWELLLGIAVASYRVNTASAPLVIHAWIRILAFAGLFLIILAVVTPHSGDFRAILSSQMLACFGATLIIATGIRQRTEVHKILSFKPIVGIGLISYSLYLWHWPLLSLLSYWQDGISTKGNEYMVFLVLILSVVFAILTWKYVEQPFRNKQHWPVFRLIKTVVIVQTMLVVTSCVIWQTKGLPQRFNAQQRQYALGQINDSLLNECLNTPFIIDLQLNSQKCVVGAYSNQPPRFIIWGDSHSAVLTPAFSSLGEQYHVNGIQMSMATVPALLNLRLGMRSEQWNNDWQQYNKNILQFIANTPSITDVFLISRWAALVLERTQYEANIFDGKSNTASVSYSDEHDPLKAFQLGLIDVVTHLSAQGKRVWFVLPIPEADRNVPRWLTLHEKQHADVWIKGYPERRAILLPVLKQIKSEYGLRLIDPTDILCRNNKTECRINANGKALYIDDNHVSVTGAHLLEDALRPAFKVMH